MIRDSALHRGSTTDRRMNPAEIIVRKVQTKRGVQVVPLLTESIR
jgi:hypothetical protein